jgi:hypothetical protein
MHNSKPFYVKINESSKDSFRPESSSFFLYMWTAEQQKVMREYICRTLIIEHNIFGYATHVNSSHKIEHCKSVNKYGLYV